MKTFICILVLAVASCKAGYDGSYSGDYYGNSGQTGYNNGYESESPSGSYTNFAQGSSDFSPVRFLGPKSYGHTNAQVIGYSQNQGSEPNQNQEGQHQEYAPQSRGFDLGNHGDATSFTGSGHDFEGDSYLKAAHELGFHGNFNAGDNNDHSNEGQENHEEVQNEVHGNFGNGDHQNFVLQDGGEEYGHGGDHNVVAQDGFDFHHGQAFPVGEHTDVESPVSVPLYKHVTFPIHKPIQVNVPKPVLVGVPQPYPVKVPVHKPVAVPVETEISIPVEKVVPYPIVKHVPYPVEKHVPYKIEKTVTVHVPKPYPVRIPVYKTIHHNH